MLDCNKLLTLPNGERLSLPPNVRIMFEVQDLKYATLATVSRCGMVWFSEDVLTCEMIFGNYLQKLQNVPLVEEWDEGDKAFGGQKPPGAGGDPGAAEDDTISPVMQVGWRDWRGLSIVCQSPETLHDV